MTRTAPPRHVGIIMDGNGRWARSRGLPRTAGHRQGLAAAKDMVKCARAEGITYLSLYTFSTENWKRTEDEVSFLMKLILTSLRSEYEFYKENGIRILHSGDLSTLPGEIREEISLVEEDTKMYSALCVNLVINYGGRDEILRAVKSILAEGIAPGDLDEAKIGNHLDQSQMPDLDLIIRTGGEKRLSNFMLWQASYAELYFSDALWPDFSESEFQNTIDWFCSRNRRFGGV